MLVGASVTIPIKDGKLVSEAPALRPPIKVVSLLNSSGPRNVAGPLPARIPCLEAPTPSSGYYPGRESVIESVLTSLIDILDSSRHCSYRTNSYMLHITTSSLSSSNNLLGQWISDKKATHSTPNAEPEPSSNAVHHHM